MYSYRYSYPQPNREQKEDQEREQREERERREEETPCVPLTRHSFFCILNLPLLFMLTFFMLTLKMKYFNPTTVPDFKETISPEKNITLNI